MISALPEPARNGIHQGGRADHGHDPQASAEGSAFNGEPGKGDGTGSASQESGADPVPSTSQPGDRNASGASMPIGRPSWVMQAVAMLGKDLRAELRNRAAVNSVLLFSVTALVVVGFATGSAKPNAEVKAALLWIVLFFAAFSGLSHIFLHEEDAGTAGALRLAALPEAVFLGKLLFNVLLMLGIAVIVAPFYVVLLDVQPLVPWGYAIAVGTGCLGLAVAATIVAAIIAKARGKGALYGALGFPILIPLLFMAVDGSRSCLIPGVPLAALVRDLVGMASFTVMLVTASLLLFPYVWED